MVPLLATASEGCRGIAKVPTGSLGRGERLSIHSVGSGGVLGPCQTRLEPYQLTLIVLYELPPSHSVVYLFGFPTPPLLWLSKNLRISYVLFPHLFTEVRWYPEATENPKSSSAKSGRTKPTERRTPSHTRPQDYAIVPCRNVCKRHSRRNEVRADIPSAICATMGTM